MSSVLKCDVIQGSLCKGFVSSSSMDGSAYTTALQVNSLRLDYIELFWIIGWIRLGLITINWIGFIHSLAWKFT